MTDADWIAGTNQLAVLRRDGEKTALDFPLGNTVYESQGALWFMRVSPAGDRVALCAGDFPGRGDVIVLDRSGKMTTLSKGWVGLFGLAWSPAGDEVWFTATRSSPEEGPPTLRAVSLSGRERLVARAPTWLFLNDVFRDGRILLGSNVARAGVRCLLPGDAGEREMGWLDSSLAQALSADGKTLLFGEGAGRARVINGVFAQGVAGGAPQGAVYLRNTDGSPAVRLGEGYPEDLSPDGKWVLVRGANAKEWTLLPTGPGMAKRLPLGPITKTYVGQWLDDRHIVFSGFEPGRPMRGFIQDVADGTIRPVTPEGVFPAPEALVVPGAKSVLATSGGQWQLYPVDGGDPRPLPFPTPARPAAWSGDGRSLYVTDLVHDQTVLTVYRQDVRSGRRQLWRTLSLSDPAGIESIGPVVMTPDASSYCYTYTRTQGTLYSVQGLK